MSLHCVAWFFYSPSLLAAQNAAKRSHFWQHDFHFFCPVLVNVSRLNVRLLGNYSYDSGVGPERTIKKFAGNFKKMLNVLVLPRRAEHWGVLVAVVFVDVLSAVDARAAAVAVAAASVAVV